MTPIFLDTEFSGLHQQAYLLSLALVPPSGPWFYGVFTDADTAQLSPWHQENVVPYLELTDAQLRNLPPGVYLPGTRDKVLPHLRDYLAAFTDVVMWADVPAYDWVLFCELFGGALALPKNIHYMVRDLATLFEAQGHDIDTDRFAFAHAGADAGAVVRSGDGRGGAGEAAAATPEGLLRHNALGDALVGFNCYRKLIGG